MTIQLLADSGADLPKSYINEHKIHMIPLRVNLDGNEYDDSITIQPEDIYEAMRNGKSPKTSQASPKKLKDIFTELAKRSQPSLYVAFSSGLSGTYQTAVMMRNEVLEEYPDFDLRIIDTKGASFGCGLAVMYAQDLISTGNTIQEVEQSVKDYCESLQYIFTVDDLDYLARGGRISKTSAFVGGMLSIKPLMHMEDGKLVPLEKIRGRKKLVKRMIEVMKERGVNLDAQRIGISHGDDIELANEVKELIEEAFHPKEIIISMIGAAIGAHSGPGTLAVFFAGKR